MTPTLLLFDIDGTLLRTNGAGMRAMERVGQRLFGPGFTFKEVVAAGNLDPLIYAEGAQRHGVTDHPQRHDEFRRLYLEELRQELERVGPEARAMPGIIDVVRDLKRRELERGDVLLGLLTGNYAQAAPIKLMAVGLDPQWFTLNAFADDGRTRAELVEVALERYRQRMGVAAIRRRVIVIGDTPRDIACAQAHGCRCLAVATGPYDMATLAQAGADEVVADLTDPQPLHRMIAQEH